MLHTNITISVMLCYYQAMLVNVYILRLNTSIQHNSGFMNMNFSQESSIDEVGASVMYHLPTLNYDGLGFSKGGYPNRISGDKTNGTFGGNTDYSLLW